MKRSFTTKMLALAVGLATLTFGYAQTPYHTQALDVKLSGTSTLHDWHMDAKQGTSDAAFVVEGDKLTSIAKLNFTLPVRNLKSESSGLDKNAYKAMNVEANPNIQFVLTASSITPAGGNNYNIKAVGKLTISGTTKDTELQATGTYNPADKSITVNGSKKMKMTDFNVKPPTVMMGTIKTGNDITISYNLKYTK
ncbi:YceI family protein [Aridibaculum aurantiacum]|uniref:YceI family protein n=1 Tax=Aridibaculum aurantiacum TaxID=2810307 RepID=UPI001A95B48B|nr:YceI family protein [Aridibaculum aurantiacum]